jgi:hypothetical protein
LEVPSRKKALSNENVGGHFQLNLVERSRWRLQRARGIKGTYGY